MALVCCNPPHIIARSVPKTSHEGETSSGEIWGLPRAQSLPSGVDVRVEVLLGRLARADAIARVVVGEDVAVDPRAEADVEAAHLSQIHGVAMGEQDGKPVGKCPPKKKGRKGM